MIMSQHLLAPLELLSLLPIVVKVSLLFVCGVLLFVAPIQCLPLVGANLAVGIYFSGKPWELIWACAWN